MGEEHELVKRHECLHQNHQRDGTHAVADGTDVVGHPEVDEAEYDGHAARVEELRARLQLAGELECFGAYDVAKGLAIKDADDFVGLGGYSCLILQATKVR